MDAFALVDTRNTVRSTARTLLLSREELQRTSPWLPFGKRGRWFTISGVVIFLTGMLGGVLSQLLSFEQAVVGLVLPLAFAQVMPLTLAWRMPLIAWRLLVVAAIIS